MQSGKAVHILANFHCFRGSVVSIGFRNNFYESRSSSKLPDVHNEEIEHHKSGGESFDLDPGGTIPLPAGLQLQDVDSSLVSSGGQTIPGGHSWGLGSALPLATGRMWRTETGNQSNHVREPSAGVEHQVQSSEVVMIPLVFNVNIKVLFAPAIVHHKIDNKFYSVILVEGLSAEVNLMSAINFCISLQQLNFIVQRRDFLIISF